MYADFHHNSISYYTNGLSTLNPANTLHCMKELANYRTTGSLVTALSIGLEYKALGSFMMRPQTAGRAATRNIQVPSP